MIALNKAVVKNMVVIFCSTKNVESSLGDRMMFGSIRINSAPFSNAAKMSNTEPSKDGLDNCRIRSSCFTST